jgi:phospholipid-binding lipoprotein MlaA
MRFCNPVPRLSDRLQRPLSVVLMLPLAVLMGCATATGPQGINDPLEPVNRGVHGINVALDKVFVGPGSDAYGTVVPKPVRQAVNNVAGTLDLPGDIANDILQANAEDAGINVLRLATNLTMGVLGLFDAATAIGLPQRPTDFGETLHVWGAGEGVYVELPVFGPSTARDTVGLVVDTVANPVRVLTTGNEANAATAAGIFARLGDRYRYSDTVESILYDSADSYEQARLLYLQNRRFELGQTADAGTDDGFVDPYEDPYGQ